MREEKKIQSRAAGAEAGVEIRQLKQSLARPSAAVAFGEKPSTYLTAETSSLEVSN
jgi:hypothetical protein